MPQISFKNVIKIYDEDYRVLDKVSFSIDEGEFVFIVGPSGAGKSTLIKMLIHEDIPTSGDIIFNDRNLSTLEKDEMSILRRKVGVVFQDFKLLESKSVYENVAIALEVVDTPESEIRTIVPNVLSMVGLSDSIFKYPRQLSGGEKQRVSIARALAHEPDVLVADEPTGMIDPDSTAGIIEILEKVNSLGTTVIMSTHDERIVDKMKKRVIRLENGQIVSDKKGGKYRG